MIQGFELADFSEDQSGEGSEVMSKEKDLGTQVREHIAGMQLAASELGLLGMPAIEAAEIRDRLREKDKEIASLQSQLEEAREKLKEIAEQKLFEEMSHDEQEDACFSDGYDMCIETARSFLSKTEKNNG